MAINSSMYSSVKHNWETPQDIFDQLDDEFCFDLDPCATHENAKCEHYFTVDDDGLSLPWTGKTFVNPPYGRAIGKWVKKAYKEALHHSPVVVCLIPARTDTRWWHDWVMKADEIRFIKGRIKFVGAESCAPFPSAIVVFRDTNRDVPKISTWVKT